MKKTIRQIVSRLRALDVELTTPRRQWLLARAHATRLVWLYALAVVGAWSIGHDHYPAVALGAVWAVVLPGLAVEVASLAAHVLWSAGRAWQDTACPCCDGPAGGWDEWVDEGPDGPEDHGLTPDDLLFLDLISSGALASGPTTPKETT